MGSSLKKAILYPGCQRFLCVETTNSDFQTLTMNCSVDHNNDNQQTLEKREQTDWIKNYQMNYNTQT